MNTNRQTNSVIDRVRVTEEDNAKRKEKVVP